MKFEEENKKTGSGNTEYTETSFICQRTEIAPFLSSSFSVFSYCNLVNATMCVMPCSARPKMNVQEKKRRWDVTFT